jgi:hypothetical protein
MPEKKEKEKKKNDKCKRSLAMWLKSKLVIALV